MDKYNAGISAILPVYIKDNAEHLRLAIDSLLNQTVKPDEIIIIVDGPINQSVSETLNSYLNQKIIKTYHLKKNMGLGNALNYGIKKAKHELIARMDADDISMPHRFQHQIQLIKDHKLDLVGGQIIEFEESINTPKTRRRVPTNHTEIISLMKLRSPLSHPTIIFKRDLFENLGGYSSNIKIEDYDFFVRAYLCGAKFGNTKDDVLWFRTGSKNTMLKRRWGLNYAINEIKLYFHFLKLGYYSPIDFLKAASLKVPLRLLPFPIFKYLYKTTRESADQ